MKTWAWVFMMVFLMIGVGCATPPVQETDHEAIQQNSDKAFQGLQEEEGRRNHESRGGY